MLRKVYQIKWFDFFYFSFIKQKKLNASAVNNTLPVIPDAPPFGVVAPAAGVVDAQNTAILKILGN